MERQGVFLQVHQFGVRWAVPILSSWRAPPQERGRVFSFQSMLFNAGSIPILLFAGVIGDTLGIETVMYLLAAAILGFSWWTVWYSHR